LLKNINEVVSNKEYKNNDINLLPPEYFNNKKKVYRGIYSAFLTTILVLAIGLFFYNLNKETVDLQREIINLDKEIEMLSKDKMNQEVLSNLEQRINYKGELLKEIEKSNISIIVTLSIIENNLPKDISFINLNTNSDGNLTINGIATSDISIAEFIHNLKQEELFNNVFVGNITKSSFNNRDTYSFNMICQYRGQ